MVLQIKNLKVLYQGKIVIDDISFDVNEGEVILLSGDNGSGKSTILNAIYKKCDNAKIEGTISCNECENLLLQKDIQWFKRKSVYVEQDDYFAMNTPFEEVKYFLSFSDPELANNDYVNALFDEYQITYLKNRDISKRGKSELSGGERKIISLIVGISRKNANLYLIDEPLNNLDMKRAKQISNMINQLHINNPLASIILVSHCHMFPFINKCIELQNGKIKNINTNYQCYSCFGKANENNFYN